MKKKIIWAISIIGAIVILFVGYYTFSIVKFGMDITNKKPEDSAFGKFEKVEKEEETEQPPEWNGTERVNVLLLGGDSRGLSADEVPRSDTLMVASIDPKTKQAFLFSILRDVYVPIPEHRNERINAALALGGPDLAMSTVSEWLGIPIQYYIYADFQGFIKLVDEIGGIDFYVEKDMYYSSRADGPEFTIDLKEGMQHLDGKTALQYVRFRHDARSDYARTERQRNLMTVIAQKLQSFSVLFKLPSTLKAIEPYIETNLSLQDMWSLGNLGKKANTSQMINAQLPPQELLREETINGASVITANQGRLQEFIQEQFAQPSVDEQEQDRDENDQPNTIEGEETH